MALSEFDQYFQDTITPSLFDEFAEDVTVSGVSCKGVFESPNGEYRNVADGGLRARRAHLIIHQSDFSTDPKRGDEVVCRGSTWDIATPPVATEDGQWEFDISIKTIVERAPDRLRLDR